MEAKAFHKTRKLRLTWHGSSQDSRSLTPLNTW